MTLALKASGTARVRSYLPRKQVSGLALKASRMGSNPICGNDFLLHPVDTRQININEKVAFSGGRKHSSSRHETTEGSDGPGWIALGHSETPQQVNADQRPSKPSRPLEMTLERRSWGGECKSAMFGTQTEKRRIPNGSTIRTTYRKPRKR